MSTGPKCRQEILSIKPYVPGKPIEEVERELGITGVIKLASNENPLGPSPEAVRAIQEGANRIHMYPDGSCYLLKRELAEVLDLASENIIIGNGSDENIKLLAEAFLNPGEEVIVPTPSFSEYEFAAKVMGGTCVYSPLSDFRLDLEDMARRITGRTKIIFVCNPNNPTGSIVYDKEVDRFLEQVPEKVVIVFDEAYYEYVMHSDYPKTMELVRAGRPNVVVMRTFSKVYGLAGLRIGYAAAHKDIISSMNRVREPFNVNLLAQEAARAAIKDSQHVAVSRDINARGREYLYEQFEAMGLKYYPTEANFIWVDLGMDSRRVFQRMLPKGVIIRTGDIFGCDTYARITIGSGEQNKKLITVLEEVLGE